MLAPTKGVEFEDRSGRQFMYAAEFLVPSVANAKTKWQVRETAKQSGVLMLGSRLYFTFESQEFMETEGGKLFLLIEISDDGQKWTPYCSKRPFEFDSGVLLKPQSKDDPIPWAMPTIIPDLWDGEAYHARITAICTLNVEASLHFGVLG